MSYILRIWGTSILEKGIRSKGSENCIEEKAHPKGENRYIKRLRAKLKSMIPMEMFFKNIRYICTCRLTLRYKAKFNQQKNF